MLMDKAGCSGPLPARLLPCPFPCWAALGACVGRGTGCRAYVEGPTCAESCVPAAHAHAVAIAVHVVRPAPLSA